MKKLKALFFKVVTRETILYVLFGLLTTVINLVSFKLFDLLLGGELYLVSNVIAWVLAVSFAFWANKVFVFESKGWTFDQLKKEIPAFFGARIGSFVIEEGGLWLFVSVLRFGEKTFNFIIVQLSGKMTAKIIIGVLVVIINYLVSKFWIFKKSR